MTLSAPATSTSNTPQVSSLATATWPSSRSSHPANRSSSGNPSVWSAPADTALDPPCTTKPISTTIRQRPMPWAGKTVSLTGDFIFDTTVLLWVATVLLRGEPNAPIVSGAVLAVVSLTMLLVGPAAGVLVDRWPDKRAVMLRADLIRAGLIGGLAAAAALPATAVRQPVLLGLIGVVVAASTAVAQFFNAARFVVIGDVVPAGQRGRATGYAQATAAVAAMVGPPAAGPLLFGSVHNGQ